MATYLRFDTAGELDPVTLVLCYRSGERIGAINNYEGFTMSADMGNPREISFSITKNVTWIWNEVVDFLIVWVAEWDKYFEISAPINESISSVKDVSGIHLPEAELSQSLIHNVEIGTEKDIEISTNKNDDYTTVFFDDSNHRYSLLHRITADKCAHFEFGHIDDSLRNDSREYSFNGSSVYDAFMNIAEQVHCLFVFDSCTAADGSIRRIINAYDLWSCCDMNAVPAGCGHRGDFEGVCPKCGKTNILPGYGEDTTIFLSRENLVNSVSYSVDKDSVKNCFKLESGDDIFDAAIKNANPSNSLYIWHIPEEQRKKMSPELQDGLKRYDTAYNKAMNETKYAISGITNYNSLVSKYRGAPWACDYNALQTEITGFPNLTYALYEVMDFKDYLQTTMMPTIEMSDVPSATEVLRSVINDVKKLGVGINSDRILEVAATNAVRGMAQAVIDSRFKVSVEFTSLTKTDNKKAVIVDGNTRVVLTETWTGTISVNAYATPDDYPSEDANKYTATETNVKIQVSTDYETYLKNVAEKMLGDSDIDDYSITGLFAKPLASELTAGQSTSDTFEYALKKFSLDELSGNIYQCCEGAMTALQSNSIAAKPKAGSWADINRDHSTYYQIYYPYILRSKAINDAISSISKEIEIIKKVEGVIDKLRNDATKGLDMEKFLGEKLWKELNSFRREDVYSNQYYISDGLSNIELFDSVNEFMEEANKELIKSATLQHTISSDLKNLLFIPEFAPLIEHFDIGNWMRIEVNDEIYKLRLLSYVIDYSNFENSDVTFSDVTKSLGVYSDVDSVLSNMKRISSSYSYVAKQASKGDSAQNTIKNWTTSGLNSALMTIKNNTKEEVTLGNAGLLARSFDSIGEVYSPKQLRLTHNILALTEDNWETVSLGIGEHDFVYYANNVLTQGRGYGISAKFVTAGYINGSQIIGGEIYSQNYSSTSGTYMNLNDGDFDLAGGKIKYNSKDSKLTIKNVNIDWSSSTNPGVGNVIGLQDTINGLSSSINQTAAQIRSEVKSADDKLSASITQNANNIALKVSKDGIVSSINMSPESIVINANKIDIKGVLDVEKLNALGIVAGSIEAKNIKAGCWIFDANRMYDEKKTAGVNKNGAGQAFWAGGSNYTGNEAPFRVSHAGVLHATGADISGKITANNGTIGKINIITSRDASLHCYGNSLFTSTTTTLPVLKIYEEDGKEYGQVTDIKSSIQCGMKAVKDDNELVFYIKAKPESTPTWTGASDGNVFYVRADGRVVARGIYLAAPYDLEARTFSDGELRYKSSNEEYYMRTVTSKDDNGYVNNYTLELNYVTFVDAGIESNIVPAGDAWYNLGSSDNRWNNVVAKKGVSTTSDRTVKKDIKELTDVHKQFFMKLIPVSFMFTDPKSDRTHIGFIAQDVEQAMEECGLTSLDFAGLCKDIKHERISDKKWDKRTREVLDENGNPVYIYSLRYTEFIGIITYVLQDTVNRLDKLEQLVNQLVAG